MSSLMNPAEFANIRQSEEDFWWYRGMRSILFRVLEPHVAGRRMGRALEAGCGTGYLTPLLQRERYLISQCLSDSSCSMPWTSPPLPIR